MEFLNDMQTSLIPDVASVSLYRSLFDALPGNSLLLSIDGNHTILAATPKYLETNKFEKKDIIGKSIFKLCISDNVSEYNTEQKAMQTSLATVLSLRQPNVFKRYNQSQGDEGFLENFTRVTNTPVFSTEGELIFVVHTTEDTTEQVVAKKKLEESNKDFQFVTDFLPQLIWVTRPDGFHDYYNKQWYDYTGLTYGETKGEGWNLVFHPDDQPRAWEVWNNSLQTSEPYEIEYRCRRFDGEYRWFLGRALPLKDEAGNVLKWFGTCTDIHDQKMAADHLEEMVQARTRELEEQRNLLDNILKNSSNGITVTEMIRNDAGQIIDASTIMANDAAVKYIGLSKDDFFQRPPFNSIRKFLILITEELVSIL